MKISAISLSDYQKTSSVKKVSNNCCQNTVFNGKHFARNVGIGAGGLVSLVGAGLWTLATGGVPLIIAGLMAAGTAGAGAFGDVLDKSVEEDEKNNK